MPDVVVLGFPRSTFVHIARLVLTHKQVPHTFRDLEPEMGSATHLALHPFNRVPILQHGDFTLYETSAIAAPGRGRAYARPLPTLRGRRSVRRPGAAAQGRARTRAHEPVDQRRQFLLLPLHDLSRVA